MKADSNLNSKAAARLQRCSAGIFGCSLATIEPCKSTISQNQPSPLPACQPTCADSFDLTRPESTKASQGSHATIRNSTIVSLSGSFASFSYLSIASLTRIWSKTTATAFAKCSTWKTFVHRPERCLWSAHPPQLWLRNPLVWTWGHQ